MRIRMSPNPQYMVRRVDEIRQFNLFHQIHAIQQPDKSDRTPNWWWPFLNYDILPLPLLISSEDIRQTDGYASVEVWNMGYSEFTFLHQNIHNREGKVDRIALRICIRRMFLSPELYD